MQIRQPRKPKSCCGATTLGTRGYSSAGRASEWHSEGQRFDPAYLHQNYKPQGQKPCGFVIPRGSDAPHPNRTSTPLAPIFLGWKMGAFLHSFCGDLK